MVITHLLEDEDEDQWPITRPKLSQEQLETVQRFQKGSTGIKCLVSRVNKSVENSEMDDLVARCGCLEKLIRATAYILQWLGRASKLRHGMDGKMVTGEITAREYDEA